MFDIFSLIAGIIIGAITVNELYIIKRMLRTGKMFFSMLTSAIGSALLCVLIIYILFKIFKTYRKR